MKVLGIICEYNPFHNGHLYQINKAKEITGADYVVAVMSGNFVQRGIPAIIDKHVRTEVCLKNNIDLVIELPVQFATGSAEYFSNGAISILNKMNIIDYVCFGCEYDNLQVLSEVADFLNQESDLYIDELKSGMANGLSFPKSRALAISKHLDYKFDLTEILASPNNILAIEYLKSLKKSKSKIKPIAIKRIGAGYNSTSLDNQYCSATSIRNYINNNLENFVKINYSVPYDISDYVKYPITENDFSLILGDKLLKYDEFSVFFDVNPLLSKRISSLKNEFISFSQFAGILKTKNITHTSINRALLHILLEIKQQKYQIKYLRVLGFKKASSKLLTELKVKTKLPIISKIADSNQILSKSSMVLLNNNIHCDNLYRTVLMNKYGISIPNEYKKGIILNS